MAEVKFCENNFSHGTEEVMEKLKSKFPDVTIETESCLGYCGDCAEGPYALVNDDVIKAESAEELYEVIVEALNE